PRQERDQGDQEQDGGEQGRQRSQEEQLRPPQDHAESTEQRADSGEDLAQKGHGVTIAPREDSGSGAAGEERRIRRATPRTAADGTAAVPVRAARRDAPPSRSRALPRRASAPERPGPAEEDER